MQGKGGSIGKYRYRLQHRCRCRCRITAPDAAQAQFQARGRVQCQLWSVCGGNSIVIATVVVVALCCCYWFFISHKNCKFGPQSICQMGQLTSVCTARLRASNSAGSCGQPWAITQSLSLSVTLPACLGSVFAKVIDRLQLEINAKVQTCLILSKKKYRITEVKVFSN